MSAVDAFFESVLYRIIKITFLDESKRLPHTGNISGNTQWNADVSVQPKSASMVFLFGKILSELLKLTKSKVSQSFMD